MNKILKILTKEQLIQEFKNLGSATKIAEKYNISPITVYSVFKEIDFSCIVKTKKTFLTKENLEKDYAEMQSFSKIAEKYNTSKETIRNYFHKLNIPYNKLQRYTCNEDFFLQDNETSFYIAGFLAADGCVKHRILKGKFHLYETQITLNEVDGEILLKIKEALEYDGPIRKKIVKGLIKDNKKYNDTVALELTIVSEKLFNSLKRFNIVQKKSLIYEFPEWLKNHPLVHHFIRGYNDGDGSFYQSLGKKKKVPQMCFALRGTQNCLLAIEEIFVKNNLTKPKKIRISSGHPCLEYGGNRVLSNIVNFLYKDTTIYLERKYQKIKHLIK